MTSRWRRLLSKVCDVVFTIPVGTDIWGYSQHEPSILRITFPFIKHRPWRLQNMKLMEKAQSKLQSLPSTSPEWGGSILCKLCLQSRGLDQLLEDMMWTMLQGDKSDEFPVAEPEVKDGYVTLREQDTHQFMVGRNGDHLMTPFQCDLCHFRNINL
jgi:hypothetical protein